MFLLLFFSSFTTLILIYNIFFLQNSLIGGGVFLIYLFLNSYLADSVLKNLFPVNKILRFMAGLFIVFYLLFSLGAISIVLYRFDDSIMAILIAATNLLCFAIYLYNSCRAVACNGSTNNHNVELLHATTLIKAKLIQKAKQAISFLSKSRLTPLYILMVILFLIGFYTLFASSEPNQHILTPWQAIPPQFIWVIILLTIIILGLIIFRTRPILLFPIILFSLLIHLYIPAVYQLPFGGDSWRHTSSILAIEQTGKFPIEKQDYISFGESKIPSALFTAPSYASLWSNNIFLHKILHLDLTAVMAFAPYLIFSLFAPLLMYIFISLLGAWQTKNILLGSFLLNLFFPLQSYGSVALPVGIGFLCFLLFLITAQSWAIKRKKFLLILLVVQLFLLFWGYIIYFVFGLLIFGFLLIYYKSYTKVLNLRWKVIRIVYLLASIALIPLVSLWFSPNARFVVLSTGLNYAGDFFKHFFLYFFGFKRAEDFHLQTGNLIWHNMAGGSTPFFPFKFEYFDTILLLGIAILLFTGFRVLIKKNKTSNGYNGVHFFSSLLLYLLVVVFGSIFLDNYYLGGIHLLTERLDLVANLLFIMLMIYALNLILNKSDNKSQISNLKSQKYRIFYLNWKTLGIILLLSFTLGSTYLSGPIHGRVTKTHYEAMQALYREIKKSGREDYCVLAEHFPLLALEVASQGNFKNGNFPIKYGYFEDRGQLFVRMFSNPKIQTIKQAMQVAQTPRGCYFILDSRFMAKWSYGAVRDLLGLPIIKIDDVYVWRYDAE